MALNDVNKIMKYGWGFFLSIWPLLLVQEFGFWVVLVIIINFWVGVAIGEYIQKQETDK